jgi:hypothetical protein
MGFNLKGNTASTVILGCKVTPGANTSLNYEIIFYKTDSSSN